MNPMANALAQAQISEMYRQACRSRLAGIARAARRRRTPRTPTGCGGRFVPLSPSLFHH